ncbi:MAG: ferritin family protein [Dehalococcoidales bacterium]|nr:ferritin family protein [Dehalococcoidales bacterium]
MELSQSRTGKNLEAAFAGESQARNKYTFFAAVAKEAGFAEIAEAFLEAAENERAHAKRLFDFLGGIGDTEANLKAAANGEHHEWDKMYPEFEQTAREEGFTQIAAFFKNVSTIEEQHEKRFLDLLNKVEKKEMAKKGEMAVWKCHNCGWAQEDTQAPDECPTCNQPQSAFQAVEDSIGGNL